MRASDGATGVKTNGRPYAVAAGPLPATTREIPYDYVASFTLDALGSKKQEVINVSVDGAFVAVSIGYSYYLDPQQYSKFFASFALTNATVLGFPVTSGSAVLLQSLLLKMLGLDFTYVVIDSGSGRELQNAPIHNVAGLGEPFGRRPFRPLAKPILFMPRSTIRIEVEPISRGALYQDARLYIVLHGYKILGYTGNSA
jgi:hypothetical protein